MKHLVILTLFIPALAWSAEVLDGVIAVVGEEPVLISDVTRLERQIRSNKALANIYGLDPSKVNPKALLDRMIEDKVVQQAVKELDVSVSDSEVETQITTIAKQNNITKDQLTASLRNEGVDFETYKRNIRSQLEKRNIFDHELRKGGGGIPENDLRKIYFERAEREYKLSLLSLKNTRANREKLVAIAKRATAASSSGKVTLSAAAESEGATSLDWLALSSLEENLQKSVAKAKAGEVIGPVVTDNKVKIFFVESERRGSEELFQKRRGELMQAAQVEDFDRRFNAWVERKKKEMHIVVNQK